MAARSSTQVLVIALLAAIPYLNGLGNGFVFDDVAIAVTFSADYLAARLGETGTPSARLPDRSALPFHLQNVLWARGADWKNNLALFESAARASPLSCKVHYNLAGLLVGEGQLDADARANLRNLEDALGRRP